MTTTTTSTTTTTVNVPLPTNVIEPLLKASTVRSTSTSQQSDYIHRGADYIMKDAMKQTIDKRQKQQRTNTSGPSLQPGRRRESFERLQRQMIHGVIQHRNEAPCRSARDSLNVETMTIKKKTQRQQRPPPSSTRNTSNTTTTTCTLTSNNPSNDNNDGDHHDNNKENQITGSSTNNMPATTTTTTAVKSTRSLMTIQTERTQKRDNLTHWYDQEMEQDEEVVQEVQVQQQYTTSTPIRTRTARTTASPKSHHHHQPLMSITTETPQQQSTTRAASSQQRRTRTATTTPRRNPPPPPSPFSRTTPSSSRRSSNRNGERHNSNNSDSHSTPPQTQSQLPLSPGERSTYVTSIKADYTSPSNHHDRHNSMRSPVAVTYFTENRHVQQQQQRQTSTTSTTEGHRGTLPYGTTKNDVDETDDTNSFGNASIPWARTSTTQQQQENSNPSSKKLTFQDMLYYAFAVCRAPDVNRSVLIEEEPSPTKNQPQQSMPLQGQREVHLPHVATTATNRDLTTKRDDVDDDVQSQTTQDLLDSVATPSRKPYFVDWTSPASCCSQGTSRTRTTTTSATPSQYTTNSAIMSTQGLYRGCK